MTRDKQYITKSEIEEEVIEFNYKTPQKIECVFCGKQISSWIGSYRMCYECFINYDW